MDTDEEYGEALPASGSGRGKNDFPRALSWSILITNQSCPDYRNCMITVTVNVNVVFSDTKYEVRYEEISKGTK